MGPEEKTVALDVIFVAKYDVDCSPNATRSSQKEWETESTNPPGGLVSTTVIVCHRDLTLDRGSDYAPTPLFNPNQQGFSESLGT